VLVPGRMETFHWVVVQSIFSLVFFHRSEEFLFPHAWRNRWIISVWVGCIQKRKAEGRAAKLVKMAHSAARAARHDTEGSGRKVKFQLPAAPGREKVLSRLRFHL
jgi:hypothetical protein